MGWTGVGGGEVKPAVRFGLPGSESWVLCVAGRGERKAFQRHLRWGILFESQVGSAGAVI